MKYPLLKSFVIALALWSTWSLLACFPGDDDDESSIADDDSEVEYDCLPDDFDLPGSVLVERTALGYTEELDLEDYLKGVLPQEIGTSFPTEAMRAQAVAARSYVVAWIRGGQGAICDTTQCQVYSDDRYDVTNQAVDDTKGIIGYYDGDVIQAVFFASCGGHTENVEDVWGNSFDYLVSVPCIENELCADECDEWPSVDDPICEDTEENCCYGRYGHGVGLCQRGAQAMAECGYDHKEILTHYYQGITLAGPCS